MRYGNYREMQSEEVFEFVNINLFVIDLVDNVLRNQANQSILLFY